MFANTPQQHKTPFTASANSPAMQLLTAWESLLKEEALPESAEAVQIARQTCMRLLRWKLPQLCISAALLQPLLMHGTNEKKLEGMFGSEAVRLAKKTLSWQNFYPGSGLAGSAEPNLYILQWLFRQLYRDYPDFNMFYLIIARHDARLHKDMSESAALETMAIYIPLVDMLGVWFLHRQWLDMASAILQPERFTELQELTGGLAKYTTQTLNQIAQGDTFSDIVINKSLREKALTFNALETALVENFKKEHIHPAPRILTYPVSAGSVLHPLLQSESETELLDRVVLRILCHTREDCYRVLGLIHRLGKPVAPRFSARFDDCIADPQANGYQALHTSIMFRRPGGGIKLVAVRILTPLMHRMNETGIFMLAAQQHIRRWPSDGQFWWSKIKTTLTRTLHQLNPELAHLEFQHWLGTVEPGTITNPTYVFTPRGEIMLLAANSTALDYAYVIHTELGHHASRIMVNNDRVSFDYTLRNGDLVLVQSDPASPGPDLQWMNMATTARARKKIKNELIRQAGRVHAGRTLLLSAVMKQLESQSEYYANPPTTAQLDHFLHKTARAQYDGDINRLYEQIYRKPVMGFELAHNLACSELAYLLEDMHGASLANGEYEVLFCPYCQPLPGQPVIGVLNKKQHKQRAITIHVREQCKFTPNVLQWRFVSLRWISSSELKPKETENNTKKIMLFQVHAENRTKLLGDALSIFYAHDDANVLRVNAHTYSNGSALLSFTVELDAPGLNTVLQHALENLRDVRSCWCGPASHAQHVALSGEKERLANPYLEREVYSRLDFYDREDKVRAILDWLYNMDRKHAILHGQKRVGKTSLAKYLANEILRYNQAAFPVLVDLQRMGTYTAERLASLIVEKVFEQIRAPLPEQHSATEPAEWMVQALREAVRRLNGRKLLLIVDEFNTLLVAEQNADISLIIFRNLRSVMAEDINVSWLLIMQDNEYMDPSRWGGAHQIIQQAHSIHLANFDINYARKLILEPLKNHPLKFINPNIPDQIIHITAGSPFLIKIVCSFLVEAAANQHNQSISQQDLEDAIIDLLSEGERYFDHFIKVLTPRQMEILVKLDLRTRLETETDYDIFVGDLNKTKKNQYSPDFISHAIESMASQGILTHEPQSNTIKFAVPLFQRWLHLKYAKTTGKNKKPKKQEAP